MAWPRATDYCEAVQNLRVSMVDEELREGRLECTSLGLPMLWAGNFADVYKVHCPATGNTWALKCFTREVRGLQARYRTIAAHLDHVRLPFTVDFQYLENGIRVGGQAYPMLKMRWVEGLSLTQFVEEHLERPRNLKMLLDLWVRLAARLREARVAHADLQHGNVLLVPVSGNSLALRLIDYDGMYVPPLAGARSGELGHPAYQHPERLSKGIYNAEVDRFSHLAIYGAVRCLMVGRRELWDHFNNGDNLLFREADFHSPERSTLFHTIWDLGDPEVRAITGRLILACLGPLEAAPLLDEIVTDAGVRPLERGDQAAVESILRWSRFGIQGSGFSGQGSGFGVQGSAVRGPDWDLSVPTPAGALISSPSLIPDGETFNPAPVLADLIDEPPVVAPPVALPPAVSLPSPLSPLPSPVLAPPVAVSPDGSLPAPLFSPPSPAPAVLETICQDVLEEEPAAARPLTAGELTLPGNDWWGFLAPPPPALTGVGAPRAIGVVLRDGWPGRAGVLLWRAIRRTMVALGHPVDTAAWLAAAAARPLQRVLQAVDRPLAAMAGEGNTILHGFLRCLAAVAFCLLFGLCGRMAWSYRADAASYRFLMWPVASPAGPADRDHKVSKEWEAGIGDWKGGETDQGADDRPLILNPCSPIRSPAPPAEPAELHLQYVAPQTAFIGQPLTVPLSVDDAGYWKGKVRYSLVGKVPPGMTLGSGSGVLRWTPPADTEPGTHYYFAWADSPGVIPDTRMLDITVRPGRPDRRLRLKPIGPKVVAAGGMLRFSAPIEDEAYWRARGDLNYRCEPARRVELWRAPELIQPTGMFTWSPSKLQRPGNYDFTMSVSGPQQSSDRCDFTVRVLSPVAPGRRPSRASR